MSEIGNIRTDVMTSLKDAALSVRSFLLIIWMYVGLNFVLRIIMCAMSFNGLLGSLTSVPAIFVVGFLYDAWISLHILALLMLFFALNPYSFRASAIGKVFMFLFVCSIFAAVFTFFCDEIMLWYIKSARFGDGFNYYFGATIDKIFRTKYSYYIVARVAFLVTLITISLAFARIALLYVAARGAFSQKFSLQKILNTLAVVIILFTVDVYHSRFDLVQSISNGMSLSLTTSKTNRYIDDISKNGTYNGMIHLMRKIWPYESVYMSYSQGSKNMYGIIMSMLNTSNVAFVDDISDLKPEPNLRGVIEAMAMKKNVVMIYVDDLNINASQMAKDEDCDGDDCDTQYEQVSGMKFVSALARNGLYFNNAHVVSNDENESLLAAMLSNLFAGKARAVNSKKIFSLACALNNNGYVSRFIYDSQSADGILSSESVSKLQNACFETSAINFRKKELDVKNESLIVEEKYDDAIAMMDNDFEAGNFFHTIYHAGASREDVDASISNLFAKIKRKSWFRKTIFIVTGGGFEQNKTRLPIDLEASRVPLIIYMPNVSMASEITTKVSQVDIMPTIAGLLGIKYIGKFDGIDLSYADESKNSAFVKYGDSMAYFIDDKMIVLQPYQNIAIYEASSRKGRASLSGGNNLYTPIDIASDIWKNIISITTEENRIAWCKECEYVNVAFDSASHGIASGEKYKKSISEYAESKMLNEEKHKMKISVGEAIAIYQNSINQALEFDNIKNNIIISEKDAAYSLKNVAKKDGENEEGDELSEADDQKEENA